MSYCLLDGTYVAPEFDSFPYLASVIEKLIDLKIQEPNLSDKQRLARVIINERAEVISNRKKI